MGASRRRAALLFLAPMLLTLALVAGWPLARTIWFGFTDASLTDLDGAAWIGLGNYLDWLPYGDGSGEWIGLLVDRQWWRAVWNTLVFTFVTVSVETALGLAIALVLNADFPMRGVVRAAVLVPWAIPTVVSAKMWAWMLNDQFGIINDLGMKLGLLSAPVAWVASPDTAMVAVMLVDIWKSTPFMALLILAGLQMIPRDIYEAARIDGVNPIMTFWRVTLPLAAPAILVAVIFRALDALRVFDIVYVLTPNNSETRTMSVFVQENLFQFDQFSYGSAASTLLFLVIAMITLAYIRAARLNLD
ncbi:trehalose/maltose ABC transporter permease [Agaricicola taiwanensis]|uniref:Trehalose/maltose ABC transporter permease n=1 Tax=Agaricicola taiwanensis TaxID=591372 RepID=A0A8J2YF28_9RHOB|nr:sugar ABC transporter permease [Agaricicola taiwanensis]GGE28185.1 trehalose/maltose ABC transporter permease [Agaricicola taiwanensis]